MATLKQRLHRKNSSGTYDIVHFETEWNCITGKPNTFTPSSHTHSASQISAGTLSGKIVANASAVSDLSNKQVRNIYAGTADIGTGASLPTGDIYLVIKK